MNSSLQESTLSVEDRYQEKPFPGSSHSWALNKLLGLSPQCRVLDVGPGSGLFGRALRVQGVAQICAVEIDQATRQRLHTVYDEIVEGLSDLKPHTGFDIVLLLDVLEHMADPESFLRELQKHLAPNAKLLISVPNFLHWSVRIPILFGIFRYYSRGILDRTHLQFFTLARIRALSSLFPGSKIIDIDSSISPAEFVLPQSLWNSSLLRIFSSFRLSVARAFPGIAAYQILCMLRCPSSGDQ
jgi:SAM-dependent methyltransferase